MEKAERDAQIEGGEMKRLLKIIFAEINKIKPGLKVLIISGDREDERIGELLSLGCIGFIPKPFSVNLLDQKIRENLCA